MSASDRNCKKEWIIKSSSSAPKRIFLKMQLGPLLHSIIEFVDKKMYSSFKTVYFEGDGWWKHQWQILGNVQISFKMTTSSYLGPCAPSGSFCMMSMSLSVQSPAERMWTLKKSSSGAEVMVKGCHSSWEMAGQLRKTYWPTSMLKPFFTSCSSSTLDGRITIWRRSNETDVTPGVSNWQKGPRRSANEHIPSCIWLSAGNGSNAARARKGTAPSDRSPTSRSEIVENGHVISAGRSLEAVLEDEVCCFWASNLREPPCKLRDGTLGNSPPLLRAIFTKGGVVRWSCGLLAPHDAPAGRMHE